MRVTENEKEENETNNIEARNTNILEELHEEEEDDDDTPPPVPPKRNINRKSFYDYTDYGALQDQLSLSDDESDCSESNE